MSAVERAPRVALTLSRLSDRTSASRQRYLAALERAGATVVALDPGAPLPDDIDGVCFSGGGDIHPKHYGDSSAEACEDIDEARDQLELALATRALARDLPVLGICRGFQLLNVAAGGTLVRHVEAHRPRGDEVVEHRVTALARSRLAHACPGEPLLVNSRHHQAVTARTLAPTLRPTAFVEDVVEAFESTRHRWVVGVQWHPERTTEVGASAAKIFDAFVAAAARTQSPAR